MLHKCCYGSCHYPHICQRLHRDLKPITRSWIHEGHVSKDRMARAQIWQTWQRTWLFNGPFGLKVGGRGREGDCVMVPLGSVLACMSKCVSLSAMPVTATRLACNRKDMEHVEMPGLGIGCEAATPLPLLHSRVSFSICSSKTQARDQM